MTITLAVLLGFALDWLLGDPKKLPHPVCAVGKLISGTEKVLRRIFPATPASLTFAGILLWLITCGVSFAVPFFLLDVYKRQGHDRDSAGAAAPRRNTQRIQVRSGLHRPDVPHGGFGRSEP